MNIGIFAYRDLTVPGGTANRVNGLVYELIKLKCNITLFTIDASFENCFIHRLNYDRKELGLLLIENSISNKISLSTHMTNLGNILNTIEEQKLDIIHFHKHISALYARIIERYFDIPMIFDIHGIEKFQKRTVSKPFLENLLQPLLLPLFLRVEKNLFTNFKYLSVTSEKFKRYIHINYDKPLNNIYVVPDGIMKDFFNTHVSDEIVKKVIEEDGLQGRKVILYTGSFKLRAGIEILIESFKNVCKQRDDIVLVMLGDGILMKYVKSFKEADKLNIVLKGTLKREYLRIYHKIADVIVVPETMTEYMKLIPPVKLFDGLASGKAVITTRVPGIMDVVKDGKTAILVNENDVQDLTDALIGFFENPRRFKSIGVRGKELVNSEFTSKRSAERVVCMYKKILEDI